MAKCFGGLGSKPKKKCSSSSFYQPLLCNLEGSVFSPFKGSAKSIRNAPPAHYVLKILSFSKLIEEYNSSVFEVGGFKWKLCIYPKGNKHEKGENHISIYLVMEDSFSLALGWEVKASIRFSLFNQIHCKYLTAKVHGRHFNGIKKKWGFARFISLSSFRKCSNGYLVDDQCVFGVEVFDIVHDIHTWRGECLSLKKEFIRDKYTWKITRFSQLGTDQCYSPETLIVEDYIWRIVIFQEGNGNAKGKHISLYLKLINHKDLPPGCKLNVSCYLRVVDQIHGMHQSHSGSEWFNDSKSSWGLERFMPLSEFNNPEKGFLVKDTCIVKAEVAIIGKTNVFS